jgi:hypothetical protein
MTKAQIHRPAAGDVIELHSAWDALGRLASARRVESGTPKQVSFAYDHAGARVIEWAVPQTPLTEWPDELSKRIVQP